MEDLAEGVDGGGDGLRVEEVVLNELNPWRDGGREGGWIDALHRAR